MKCFQMPIFVIIFFSLGGCFSKTPIKQEVTRVSPREAMGLLSNQFAVLVDVREEGEIKESGIASGATSIPLSKIEAGDPKWQEFQKRLSKDKQVIFYCRSGGRAGSAAQRLADQGYKAANMGGFDDWKDAGLPVQKFE